MSNGKRIKKRVDNFLSLFDLESKRDITIEDGDVFGYFGQFCHTREQYMDMRCKWLNLVGDVEQHIKQLKDRRFDPYVAPYIQSEHRKIEYYATSLYRFRESMKRWRTSTWVE